MAASQLIIFSIKQASNAHARLSLFLPGAGSRFLVAGIALRTLTRDSTSSYPSSSVASLVPSRLQTLRRDSASSYYHEIGLPPQFLKRFKRSHTIKPLLTPRRGRPRSDTRSASNAQTR